MTIEQQKKRKKALKILVTLVGVFLLIGCCSIGGLVFLGNESVPVPTITATAVATLAPSVTPTPLPTHTPHPTKTPVPTASSEAQYVDEMHLLLVQWVEAQETVAELNRQAGTDATLLLDVQWKADMTLALGRALVIGSEIRELESKAPLAYREAHSLITEATEHYGTFAYLYATGVDTLDASLITQAADELALVADLMNQATEAMP